MNIKEHFRISMEFSISFDFIYSPISREQKSIENALVMFSVKDQDFLGISNKYISECFISFEDIARSDRMEQIHLKLSRPSVTGLLHTLPKK